MFELFISDWLLWIVQACCAFFAFTLFASFVSELSFVRRAYVYVLMKIFAFGSVVIRRREAASNSAFFGKRSRRLSDGTDGPDNTNPTDNSDSSSTDSEMEEDEFISEMELTLNTSEQSLISRDSVLLPIVDGDTVDSETEADTTEHSIENAGGDADGNQAIADGDEDMPITFHLDECLDYLRVGIESIIEDEVTSRFEAEKLRTWNLLTRTNRRYEFISCRVTLIWLTGFMVRYFLLLPLRVLVCCGAVVMLVLGTSIIGFMRNSPLKFYLVELTFKYCFSMLAGSVSALVTYNNPENRPRSGGICVANHTSPLDALVLMCDSNYSIVGQRHGGFLGILERALSRASPHVWFERSESKDRQAVAQRLKAHISEPGNPPVLIFPEGTCINNTSVMQFKKGCFDIGAIIYPVAIKYYALFGDPFWNSAKYSILQYVYSLMTSWAIVADVWYLPPMKRENDETAIAFANRVKAVIAKQAGLINLVWDGQLKRMKPKKEWMEKQQMEFSRRLKS